MKTINMNDTVFVKLTERGHILLRRNHDSLATISEYLPPIADNDGYSKWQLWQLFQEFGEEISLGRQLPFDSEIRIKE